jgi:CubicO group peptidase (beta-lactamase class C family)
LRLALDEVDERMPTLRALLVARRGYVALEGYWGGARASTPLDLRSVTKAVTATVVATEIRAGRLAGVEAPLSGWWGWLATTEDPRHAQLQVRHLLDLSAGFVMDAPGTVGEDAATWYLSRPIRNAPGTTWQYDEGLYEVLSYLVRKVDARGMRAAARDDLFAPLGLAEAAARWPVDGRANAHGAAGLRLTGREMLSIGELYRRDGVWDGQPILPAGWVARMRERPASLAPNEQLWTRGWRQVVLDGHLTLFTIGYGGQHIIVVPDLELVVAAGADPNVPPEAFPSVLALVRDHVIPAASPAPASGH